MDTLEQQMNNVTIHNKPLISCRVCNKDITSTNTLNVIHHLCQSCYNNYEDYFYHENCITCGNDFWQTDEQEAECPQCIKRYGMDMD